MRQSVGMKQIQVARVPANARPVHPLRSNGVRTLQHNVQTRLHGQAERAAGNGAPPHLRADGPHERAPLQPIHELTGDYAILHFAALNITAPQALERAAGRIGARVKENGLAERSRGPASGGGGCNAATDAKI